jgi:N utilization substance protein B
MGERRMSRELALKVLYQMEHSEAPADEALELYRQNFKAPGRLWDYARELVQGIYRERVTIDQRLNEVSRRWRLDRMPRVDRNILRMATYEMLYTPVPPRAVISEAVELAKRYSSDEAPAFVNGVLDSLLATLGPDSPGPGGK